MAKDDSDGDFSATIRPDGAGLANAMARLDQQIGKMARGEANPAVLRRQLEARHAELLQGNAWPGASSVKGHVMTPVIYRQLNGFVSKMMWDVLPDVGGLTVLAVCPSCYLMAPTQVDVKKATKPIAVDNQLARLMGDPEADKKLVPFRMSYPAFHCYLDDSNSRRKPRLTITETIRCPNHYRCSFIVRVNEGIAERVSSKVTNSTTKRPITGPLIKVK